MLLHLRVGRWEMTIHNESTTTEADPVPDDHPQPMQVWTPDHVGFLPPERETADDYDSAASPTNAVASMLNVPAP